MQAEQEQLLQASRGIVGVWHWAQGVDMDGVIDVRHRGVMARDNSIHQPLKVINLLSTPTYQMTNQSIFSEHDKMVPTRAHPDPLSP
jgi:hypothetical protein